MKQNVLAKKKKKKKTLIYLISGILVIALVGTVAYFAWPKKEIKTETKSQSKEGKVQQLQSQLSQIKTILNKPENSSKKVKYQTQLTDLENKLKNLSQQNNQEQTIQELEQNIKTINQELKIPDEPKPKPDKPTKNPKTPEEKDNPKGPNDKSPNDTPDDKNDPPKPSPQPDNNKGWKYVATKINDNTYKYRITLDGGEIDFSDFIACLKDIKKDNFFEVFQGALKDANSKFPAYFWECPPVSKKTLDKPFEFVVIKSEALANINQNYSSFNDYLKDTSKEVHSFSSPNKDGILVIPGLKNSLDYKNLSQFTENAPEEQQQELWKEVAEKLSEQLQKDASPRWLSTSGLGSGTSYLHVRIYDNPKYYSHAEYKK